MRAGEVEGGADGEQSLNLCEVNQAAQGDDQGEGDRGGLAGEGFIGVAIRRRQKGQVRLG